MEEKMSLYVYCRKCEWIPILRMVKLCPLHKTTEELLEVLKLLKDTNFDAIDLEEGGKILMQAKAAIAKAEPKGKTNDTTR